MAEPLTQSQLDSQHIDEDGRQATEQLARMKADYDAAQVRDTRTEEGRAVDDLLSRTTERATLGSFLQNGNSSGVERQDEIAVANAWRDALMRDDAAQKRLLSGDPDMMAKLQLYGIWAAAAHEVE
jgi:hypothetical protein